MCFVELLLLTLTPLAVVVLLVVRDGCRTENFPLDEIRPERLQRMKRIARWVLVWGVVVVVMVCGCAAAAAAAAW